MSGKGNNKAVRVTEAGKQWKIAEITEEIPKCQDNEVLVEVKACGVCYRDIIDKEGGNPYINLPISLGHEIAGVIIETGKNVHGWRAGDRVVNQHNAPCNQNTCNFCSIGENHRCVENPSYMYGLTHQGGYQKYVCMHSNSLIKLPAEISFEEGSFLFCTAGVALRGLKKANFKAGQKVLITGGSGGVGIHAIQLVKALGGVVYTTTSNPDKKQILFDYGADYVLVTSSPSFHENFIREFGLVDISLELVGQPTFHSSLRCLNLLGKVVIIGNITTTPISVNPGLLILKELSIIGSSSASLQVSFII